MAASYPTSVKSFTTKTDGVDTNAANDINALQDEVTAVETGLLSTGLTLTSGQIIFPATQNPSAGVNTLDDYEEGPSAGSWTPVIGGIGGTSGQTYSSQIGTYIKIGRFVVVIFDVTLSAKGTITGVVQIQGLPFTCSSTGTFAGFSGTFEFVTLATNWISVYGMPVSGTTTANVLGTAAAAVSNATGLVTADIANTTRLIGGMLYISSQ